MSSYMLLVCLLLGVAHATPNAHRKRQGEVPLPRAEGRQCGASIGLTGACHSYETCNWRGGTSYLSTECERAAGTSNAYCCDAIASSTPSGPTPMSISGVSCTDHFANNGVCYDRVGCQQFGWNPVTTSFCSSQGQNLGCCVGNLPGVPAPAPSPVPVPPPNTGESCTSHTGTGTCKEINECFRTPGAVAVGVESCKRFGSQVMCCVGQNGVAPAPTSAPRPQPPNGDDSALSMQGHRQNFYVSPCFTKAVHQTYLNAASRPKITIGVTAYVQDSFFSRGRVDRARIAQAIASANSLYAGSGVQFSDLRVEQMPTSLNPPSNNIANYDAFRASAKRHAVQNNPGRITIYFAHFSGTLAGELIGTWPYEPKPVDETTLFMNVDQFVQNSPPWFQDHIFNHELGHLLGLFHTFQDFPEDVCGDDWAYDIIPDTSYTPQSHEGCGASARNPCTSRVEAIDTFNIMSYGSCLAGGDPLTRDQFARVRCAVERHLGSLQRVGGRSRATVSAGRVVGLQGLGSSVPHFVVDVSTLVVQVGDTVEFDLGVHYLSDAKTYLFPTDVVRIPSESELAPYAIDGELYRAKNEAGAELQWVKTQLSYFANGEPLDRGNFALILIGKNEAGERVAITTTVVPVDVNTCDTGLATATKGAMRTAQVCSEREGTAVTQPDSNGLVCCAPKREVSVVRYTPTDRTERPPAALMTIAMWGRTFFWGQEVTVEVVQAPATGETVSLRALSTAQNERAFDSEPISLAPRAGARASFTPQATEPGTYHFATEKGEASASFSIVPLPCKMEADGRPGYCLPTTALTTASGGASGECRSGDAAPCAGLKVAGTTFKCCAGTNQFATEQGGANYRDTTSATTFTVNAVIVLVATTLALLM